MRIWRVGTRLARRTLAEEMVLHLNVKPLLNRNRRVVDQEEIGGQLRILRVLSDTISFCPMTYGRSINSSALSGAGRTVSRSASMMLLVVSWPFQKSGTVRRWASTAARGDAAETTERGRSRTTT